MQKLTPKEKAFSLKFVECNNASEAYRTAYNVGKNTKPETVWGAAYKTLAKGHVAARVKELQDKAQALTLVTVASITLELEEARAVALQEGQGSAMTSASMGKAKIHGLLIDKTDNKHEHGISDSMAELIANARENTNRIGDK